MTQHYQKPKALRKVWKKNLNRKSRSRYYIAVAYDCKIIFEEIKAKSYEIAQSLFVEKYDYKPTYLNGPYYKARVIKVAEKICISNEFKYGQYKGWRVRYMILKSPVDTAMVIFLNKLNEDAIKKPSKPQIIPIREIICEVNS